MPERTVAEQVISPESRYHIETVDGARYEVTSNYIGKVTFLDLLKQMLKRDIERERPNEAE